ncbi:MAG: N-6 DNA methylase [Gammaproteobacteria bacterium]|nr:N-6 DNA methylase [Gammaproteobacteria bacterium]
MSSPNLTKQLDELARSFKGSISPEGLLEALSLLGLLATYAPATFTELYRSGGNRQPDLLNAAFQKLASEHEQWPCDVSGLAHLSSNEWQPLIYFVEDNQQRLHELAQALRDYYRERNGKYGSASTTESTRKLMLALAGDMSAYSLYDGTARLADIPASLKPRELWLEEQDSTLWAISYRLLLIEQLRPEFVCTNSLAESKIHKKADLVIMQPPFGIRLSPKETDQLLREGNVLVSPGARLPASAGDVLWIQQALAHCAEHGRIILQLPQGWLFRGGYDAKVRDYLLNEDIIEAVIGLPPGMVSFSNIPTCILILNKQRQPGSPIHFVDGSQLGQNSRGQNQLTSEEIDLIAHLAQGMAPEHSQYRAVYLPDIRKKGTNGIGGNSLNIGEYFVRNEKVEIPDPDQALHMLKATQQKAEAAQAKLITLLTD